MKQIIVVSIALTALSLAAGAQAQEIKKGDKLQTLANLHPDMAKRLLYTTNYQLQGLIPVCADVTVTDISKKEMEFDYKGIAFRIEYEKNTKGAGVSFQDAVKAYFGPACDQAKMKGLNAADKEGVKTGKPRVGMTKNGILLALGRPPFHANPLLDGNYWLYWENRFAKMGSEFDDKGVVTGIR
jgi:hypothetical protein